MRIDPRPVANWLVIGAVLLGLLIIGQSLLVPFLFAILLWSVLNALADSLTVLRFPPWLAWVSSLVLIASALYLVTRILAGEASALASQGPIYVAKLEALATEWLAFLRLGPAVNLADVFSRYDVPGILGRAAASVGNVFFQIALVLIYVGFFLAEQRHLPSKLSSIAIDNARREEGKQVLQTIARQIQRYLGVCTLLSVMMASVTYVLLNAMHVDFAGFWALVLFLVTYIPVIGALGVVLPAFMALAQFGSLAPFLAILITLGVVHFVLTNIVVAVWLGRSLNLSPLAIILSLTFWGLIWGVPGLFLAVPIMAAVAIVCQHIEGVHWVTVLLAGPPPKARGIKVRRTP